jgi:hypothetical protein
MCGLHWKNRCCYSSKVAMPKLFKTRMRGGTLTLTDREVVLGEGWLGAQNVRRFPLHTLVHLDLLPSPGQSVLQRSMQLRFVWADGDIVDIYDVGPIAAGHVRDILQRLCYQIRPGILLD